MKKKITLIFLLLLIAIESFSQSTVQVTPHLNYAGIIKNNTSFTKQSVDNYNPEILVGYNPTKSQEEAISLLI